MAIIGLIHPNNPNDKRCYDCIDFLDHGGLIFSGQVFTCTYCKTFFPCDDAECLDRNCRAPKVDEKAELTDWEKDVIEHFKALKSAENSEMKEEVTIPECNCSACAPKVDSKVEYPEASENDYFLGVEVPFSEETESEETESEEIVITSAPCEGCDTGFRLMVDGYPTWHFYRFKRNGRWVVRDSPYCCIGKPFPVSDIISDSVDAALVKSMDRVIEALGY